VVELGKTHETTSLEDWISNPHLQQNEHVIKAWYKTYHHHYSHEFHAQDVLPLFSGACTLLF
jgi:hypothetical protein